VSLGLVTPAYAQTYPNKDVHFICAIPAGSGADVIVRFLAEKMRPLMNQPIVVENRAGASGNIATEYAARSKPDGYTIYVHAGSAVAANMHLFKRPPVDAASALKSSQRSIASHSWLSLTQSVPGNRWLS
jgi:tripartite-type tricarboxylate transporter receptor subunit TctC